MTTAAAASARDREGDRWAAMPRSERRRRRRERRVVLVAGASVLSLLVGAVTIMLGHLGQGRAAPPRGMDRPVTWEVHVSDGAA